MYRSGRLDDFNPIMQIITRESSPSSATRWRARNVHTFRGGLKTTDTGTGLAVRSKRLLNESRAIASLYSRRRAFRHLSIPIAEAAVTYKKGHSAGIHLALQTPYLCTVGIPRDVGEEQRAGGVARFSRGATRVGRPGLAVCAAAPAAGHTQRGPPRGGLEGPHATNVVYEGAPVIGTLVVR